MARSYHDAVPVEPLREAFIASGRRPADVARDLGWYTPKARSQGGCRGRMAPDGTRVKRYLGIASATDSKTKRQIIRQRVSYDVAIMLAAGIGVDPVDVGL